MNEAFENSLARPVSLHALIRSIRSGDLAATDAFEAFAERASAVEPSIGAFAATDWAAARATVAAQAGKPLAGLPVGLKDIFDTAFLPTGYGSPIYAGHRPAADAAMIDRLATAGATFPVKTTTTEFAFMEPTATRNPWATERSPGGSSAGSAAAVAAGMLPAAIGSQTAGSTVRPASFCGIAGFKPTFDRLPVAGMKAFAPSLDTVGLFAADVESLRYLFAAATGRTYAESLPEPGAITIAVVRTPWDDEALPPARRALETAITALGRAGIHLVDRAISAELVAADAAYPTVMAFEGYRTLAAERRQPDKLSRNITAWFKEAAKVDEAAHQRACVATGAAKLASDTVLGGVDALLTFAAADVAPADHSHTGSPRFNRLWTLLGLPCLSVPGLFDGGLPIGVQLVGRRSDDDALLAVASRVGMALAAA